MNTADEILSTTFELNPGIVLKGAKITDCQVRLISRADRKVLPLVESETEREDTFLTQSIARFGSITDKNQIRDLIDKLYMGDELRIREEIATLEAQFVRASKKPEEPAVKKIVRASDILSEPFSLNPGVLINGQRVTTCVVRLLSRGEWRQLEAEQNSIKKNDLYFLLSIVQFGDITEITSEHIDELLDVDVQRINDEIGRLEEIYAPDSKSGSGEPEPLGDD